MLHVGKGGLWLSHLAVPEVRKSQVCLQLSSLASSLAIHQWWEGWPPADTLWFRAFHTHQAAGARFCEPENCLQCSVLFPMVWNMVLKCLWRCVACSNIKPREVSRRSVQVPRKRPITHTHTWCYFMISSVPVRWRTATNSEWYILGQNLPRDFKDFLRRIWQSDNQLSDNMKKGWNTCSLNCLSSNDPNTSFLN